MRIDQELVLWVAVLLVSASVHVVSGMAELVPEQVVQTAELHQAYSIESALATRSGNTL